MEWTNHLSRLSDLRKAGNSVQKCAEEFNVRYGTMATVFSRYGIVSEEQKQLDKDRRLARKFALWGWSVEDIAEQLDRCHAFVRKAIKGAFDAGVQPPCGATISTAYHLRRCGWYRRKGVSPCNDVFNSPCSMGSKY